MNLFKNTQNSTPLEERVLKAQSDATLRAALLQEYQGFILSAAQKTVHHFVTLQDDEWSIALSAFNDAITKYEKQRGRFLSFAALLIKNALIDYFRHENRGEKPLSFGSLSTVDDRGEEQPFDVAYTEEPLSDAALEIEALTKKLAEYNITFQALTKDCPKAEKTRLACMKVLKYIMQQPMLVQGILKNGTLPVKKLSSEPGISRKLLERHRKYLLAGVVILSGDYPIVAAYIPYKEVDK